MNVVPGKKTATTTITTAATSNNDSTHPHIWHYSQHQQNKNAKCINVFLLSKCSRSAVYVLYNRSMRLAWISAYKYTQMKCSS